MDLQLADHHVIVTGGSSGIGLATAQLLVDEGATVTICGRDADRLGTAVDSIGSERVHAVVADVRRSDQVEGLVAAAHERAGRIDGVAAIAGRGRFGSLLDLDLTDLHAEVADKLAATLLVVRHARALLTTAQGRVVALTAPTARTAVAEMGAISVGRSALDAVIDALASEFAPAGVRVNGVGVGLIDTPRQRQRHASSGNPLDYEHWLQGEATSRAVPLARAGSAEEVAAAIVFLLSPRSSYTTGAVLDVTGGLRSR